VKVEAISEWGASVHVEMAQERYRELALVKGESVFIIPKEVKVFHEGRE
jgi:hypothetical protein